MPFGKSIAVRLVAITTACSVLILAAILGYNYLTQRAVLRAELEQNAKAIATSLANQVEARLVAVTKVTEGLARAAAMEGLTEAELLDQMRKTVEANPAIIGSAVAFEPKAFRPNQVLFAPYYYRTNGGYALSYLEDTYDPATPYPYWDWYQIPREVQRTEWTEPYFDAGGADINMTTCSVPILLERNGEPVVRGVVTADVALDSLTQLVQSVKILETGYASLLSRNGMMLAHPLKEAVMNETFFSIAEERGDTLLRAIGRKMVRGEQGFVRYTSLMGVESWLYYAPIPSTGWTLAVIFPERELLASVRRLTFTMAGMGTVGVLLFILAAVWIAASITRPLRGLAVATQALAEGNFDAELPAATTQDEVGRLTGAFRRMQGSLKQYIADLTATTAAKERIQGELNVATEIQASLLPRMFPPFPHRTEFEIYASMDPAKEVGGDFYDFFFVDERHLCFLIADVADKGVPAALYMMVAKTLLKTEGQRLGRPDEVLASVNEILAADNERCMFASVFCAILDVETGEVRCANAGHNPPLLLAGGEAQYLKVTPGFMLGPMPGASYVMESVTLRPGDALFLYTDGVTEAKSREDALFGEPALREVVLRHAADPPDVMIGEVREHLRRHAQGAAQSDDITMVALTYRGPAARAS